MGDQDPFERILGSLHEAALDDAHWPVTAGLIDEALGSKGNFLVFGERRSREDVEILFKRFCYRGERNEYFERLYYDAYFSSDERMPRFRLLPDSRLVRVAELYTDKERKTSPVFNEALPLGETQNGLNVRLDGPDGSHIGWQAADPVDGDGWSSAQVETIERLLPPHSSVRAGQAVAGQRARAGVFRHQVA